MGERLQPLQYEDMQAAVEAVDDLLNNITMLDKISSEEELDQIMPDLLASLGRYSMSDRAYIFTWASVEHRVLRMTHEWCAEGVFPTMGKMQELRISDMPNWAPRLRNGEAIVYADWNAEKEKMPEEYAIFDGQDIHSLMVIPIFANKKLNGYIGFDNPDQSKASLSVRLLSSIGGHISGLKENLYMMQELEKRQRSLQESWNSLNEEKNILDALSIDYTSVYYCDLIADTLSVLKSGNNTNNAIAEEKIKEKLKDKLHSYSYRIQYYFENFIIQESAPDFLYRLSAEYLKEYLSHNERFAYRFRAHPNPAGQQYFEVQIVRLPKVSGFKVVMGYRYIDDIIEEQEKQKIKLENALASATLNSEIIDSISKLYWLIYRMDLVTGTYEEISAGSEVHRLTGKHGKTAEVFKEVRETVVIKEHQKMMKAFLDTSTLAERLSETESISVEYQAIGGSWHSGRFIVKKRDENNRVTNVLYVVRQIDQQKQMELEYRQKLMKTAEEARRANIAKTDFLRRMSHDIRTPINGIQGMLAVAEHFPDDMEKQKECRAKVKEASGFLLDLVNSILDMNKLESGVIVLEEQSFNLVDVLEEVNNIAEMNATRKSLQISVDHSQIKHRHLIGSPLHLKQILQNIDGNAVKYNREGGSISFSTEEISCENGVATYKFVCSDTGRGMSKEFLSHAFEPFVQEDASARTAYMGTGLGLSIAKQLAEMMGGTIQVESEKGVGSTFTTIVSFKVDTAYNDETDAGNIVENASLEGLRVLLAEDNELNMEIAEFLLENAGMNVTTAVNGKEAVDIFSASDRNEFDLILMDVMMPVMDGLEATRKIRELQRPDAKEIPIFAMTANAFIEDKRRSKEAGMNEHLSKPLDEKILLDTIRKYTS